MTSATLTIGETKRGKDIGYANDRALYIWATCKNCGKLRWVQQVKGIPKYDLCGKCTQRTAALKRSKENHPKWHGGKKIHKDGYILSRVYDLHFQPMINIDGYILENRFVMAQYLGRLLDRKEVVHHKNGITTDNRIENLEICGIGDHTKKHFRLKTLEKQLII